MQCTVYIPHLVPPHELGDAFWRSVDAPQLKTLLARAAWHTDAQIDTDAWLCGAFGIKRQQDWPLAPVLARNENFAAGSGYWLCATPVHLATQRNALVLTDPVTLEISAAESAAFTATLADHLRGENVTLHVPRPDCWLLHSDTAPDMRTFSLDPVTGRDVRPFLPQGPDSPRWHRILTEIQMLLHTHPLNAARDARGLAPVNSVWLWAGGTLPPPSPAPFAAVWSNDTTVRALAQYCGCRVEPEPVRITPEHLNDGSHLFSFEALAPLMRRGEVQAWSDAVTALNRAWFMPLTDALKSRRLSTLTLISSNHTATQRFEIRPEDFLKFWRKNKYLQ